MDEEPREDRDTVRFPVRLPRELVRAIDAIAARDLRSRNNLIERLCREAVEQDRHNREEGE